MASSSRFSYDYTEGASPEDIRDAVTINKPSLRDSRYSSYGDDHVGSIFDGPGSAVIPSSVSRMSQDGSRRRSMEFSRTRRMSQGGRSVDSRRSDGNGMDGGEVADPEVPLRDDVSYIDNWSDMRSRSPPARTSVFENIVNMFGRSTTDSPVLTRRPSLSRGSTSSRRVRRTRSRTSSNYAIDDDVASGDERWGYSSGEDDEEAEQEGADAEITREGGSDLNSYPPSPTNLPLLVNDPIFGGETRIDIGVEFEPLDPPPPGPPSRQALYVSDEDVNIRFVGYEVIHVRQVLWRVCCILSFGVLALLGHWFPRLWLRSVAQEKAFILIKHGFVLVEVCHTSNDIRLVIS
jgi:cation-transporting ATPase 13A2